MPMSQEDAQFVAETRLQILKNVKEDLPPSHGIDEERLKRALLTVRKERTLGAAGSGKAGKKAAEPVIPLDLDAFMKK